MSFTDSVPIVPGDDPWDIPSMSVSGSRTSKSPKAESGKPSLTCAICKRRYQPIRTPGLHTIYSICPGCRLRATRHSQEKD